ncbi:MAG: class II fructose-bisphosphate aldolase [Eubacteriales bacterium]|nr:class II fructose-bisphosphate aldolase [Eubacteriales bacterium]
MLVTLKEILDLCEAKKCAAGAFNTPNLESLMGVLSAAEELDVPVIIQHAQVHEELVPLDIIGPIMVDMAKKASVPVAVHLDHGESLPYLQRALNMGFTSVMYDGSTLSYEENVANTRLAVSMARRTGASVEAELGCMGKRENGSGSAGEGVDPDKIYTDPDQAKLFVEATGIDALACSFGTTHGVYLSQPQLDFGVVEKVREKALVPVVMHGGSGVSEEDFRQAIRKGVRKINYYTYMAMAGGESAASHLAGSCDLAASEGKGGAPIMYHDIVRWGMEAMKENCKKAMEVFSMR